MQFEISKNSVCLRRLLTCVVACCMYFVAAGLLAEDWPQFLGPTADSKSAEKGLIAPWPDTGPEIVWARPLIESYGIGSVSAGKYYQFDFNGRQAILHCLDATTGKEVWTFSYPSSYRDLYGYNSGPRTSPVIDGDRVYIYGVEGMLHCVNAQDGSKVWSVDVNKQFNVVQNFFGVGSTPAVFEDALIVMVGGSPVEDLELPPGRLDRVSGNGSGVVAFDKLTGKVKYQLSNELASYSSPRIVRKDDQPVCFVFARGGLLGFDPRDGKNEFFYPWRAQTLESVNASNPVVVGNEVFISETYGPGSSLLSFASDNDFQVVWEDDERKRFKSMQTHWNTAVYHEGYLYGSSGRHEYNAELRCIDWKTGEVKWTQPGLTRSSLMYVDGHFVCLSEDGTLRLLRANPEKYDLVSTIVYRTADLTKGGGEGREFTPRLLKSPAWAAPILANGLMYVRGKDAVVCVRLLAD
ncbi:MAG: PQQ-like beta-propeller repeat protein [Planctomycetales bacterium]|nr:PQQ-like beta-propeller repeat protein [Planctomycetales bacterium]